jgi:hypothetical protein
MISGRPLLVIVCDSDDLRLFQLLKEQLFMCTFSFVFISDFKVIISLETDVGI